ncbi:class I adenylate-forming enzyme family protein [Rhodococcus wratislaviensis]|uniref:Putative fatty-acid--CoA ligase n=1 Tax=Rhodococcus wratislaviensis NBRC 100605 TaxID=1219028 RepID=X0PRJ5_RHOWR|nr:class I adenylate-forming enzyme family protein [Rhodococcus wratislaviensis]GAF45534.1 putative fatty-acid--CoA ligase [Rhodococcus wratislaviensis NBRC 100605]
MSSTSADIHSCRSLDDLMKRAATLWPDNVAMIDGDVVVTHRQLDEMVDRLASELVEAGLTSGMRCGIAMDHRWWNFAALLAVGRAGLAALPLNIRSTPVELQEQMARSGADALIVSAAHLARFATVSGWEYLSYVGLLDDVEAQGQAATTLGSCAVTAMDTNRAARTVEIRVDSDAPGTLWFTGGSTGNPKLVVHSRQAPVHAIVSWIERLKLTSRDRGFALNFYHISTMSNTGAMLAAGGSVVIIPEFRVPTILSLIERHKATLLITLALFPNLLVRDPSVPERYDLSSLRLVLVGGAPTDHSVMRAAFDLLPNAEWGQGWAQTELCSGGAAIYGQEFRDRIASVGKPLSCVEGLEIRDEFDRRTEAGTVGEVCIKGPSVMLRYEGAGESGDEPRNGWMHTGDLGFVDEDGYLHLAGRKRELIIRGGENLYPGEIEAVLMSHPAILECAVVGIRDTVMTEVPIAFVVRRPHHEAVTAEEIREYAEARLSRFKQPVAYEWIAELPRNSIGKIQKTALREIGTEYAR